MIRAWHIPGYLGNASLMAAARLLHVFVRAPGVFSRFVSYFRAAAKSPYVSETIDISRKIEGLFIFTIGT